MKGKALPFTKMQAVGNDFVLFDVWQVGEQDWRRLARNTADRHFAIGHDGLLVVRPGERECVRFRMFNPDGTEDMCGNGLRCISRYVWEQGLREVAPMTVETLVGPRRVEPVTHGGKVVQVRAQLGRSDFAPSAIPMAVAAGRAVDYPLTIASKTFRLTCLSVGTAHAVIFTEGEVPESEWQEVSAAIEVHPLFPERVTVDWCRVESAERLRLRVWERAVGETLGCGTGAVAVAAAARELGFCPGSVTVAMKGGELAVDWEGGEAILTGPAEIVYQGKWPVD